MLTRFLLSPDRKTYRPILSYQTPFEVHLSKKDDKLCIAEPTSLSTMTAMAPKAIDGEIIAKKREELTKSNFFHASCFDTEIPIDHRNAIMNAAADVLSTKTQDVSPETKYLRCLEKFGYAHESGTIQALQKISKTNSKDVCKLRLACTTDDEADQGNFQEKDCLITLKTSALPERDSYARLIFHELSHSVPMRDGVPLELLEECCSAGKKCDVLKAFAEKNRIGEKVSTVAEAVSQKNSVFTSTATILAGTDGESATFASSEPAVTSALRVTLAESHPTVACTALGKEQCASETVNLFSRLYAMTQACVVPSKEKFGVQNYLLGIIVIKAIAETKTNNNVQCSEPDGGGATSSAITLAELKASRPTSLVEAIEHLPQTSPITWDVPKEPATPIYMASTLPAEDPQPGQGTSIGHTPTRTIASIEPLPDEAPTRALGSAKNRRDVSSGRATVLVDTVERAARKVTASLTPEKVQLLEVDRNKIFDADYKPKTKTPQYFVTSSATKPIQVADIGDVPGLSFPNPFANQLPKEKPTTKLAQNDTGVGSDASQNSGRPAKANSASGKRSDGTVTEKDGEAGLSTDAATLTAAAFRSSRATTQATIASIDNREPTAHADSQDLTKQDFTKLDRAGIVKFLTSGYRTVAVALEKNPTLKKAMTEPSNRIRVYDHENNQIGSMNPEITFIYSSELGRLVQTRVNREKK